MYWKTKKFMWLSLLWYLHYCSDLDPNLQYCWGQPPPYHFVCVCVCVCVCYVCAYSGVNLWIAYIFKMSHFQWTQWSAFSFLSSSSDPHSNIFSWAVWQYSQSSSIINHVNTSKIIRDAALILYISLKILILYPCLLSKKYAYATQSCFFFPWWLEVF